MSITCKKDGHTYTARLAIHKGRVIDSIYYGSNLVLNSQGFVYNKSEAGTHTIHIPISGVYDIDLVGAGGGGVQNFYYINKNFYYYSAAAGGSGSHVYWWQYLEAGDYTVTLGTGGSGGGSTGGTGTDSVFLGQTAKGGAGGSTNGAFGGCTGGSGGSYTTDYDGEDGSTGAINANGSVSTTASTFGGFGAGGGSNEAGGAGGIRLVFRDLAAPALFESSTPGTYSLSITDEYLYEIIVVGAGSGSAAGSDSPKYSGKSRLATGGSGAYVKADYNLVANTYSITVGAGGAKSGTGMWTWNNGGAGGASSFADYIICTGGGPTHCAWSDWGGQYAGSAGTVSTLTEYASIKEQSNGNAGWVYGGYGDWTGAASVYNGYGKGGDGGSNSGGGWTQNGSSGYVKVSQLAGRRTSQ